MMYGFHAGFLYDLRQDIRWWIRYLPEDIIFDFPSCFPMIGRVDNPCWS